MDDDRGPDRPDEGEDTGAVADVEFVVNEALQIGGKPPLDFMCRGGVPALQTVRRLLDARRGGA